jgi:arylsulfatase A-like enzyme
MIWVAPGVTQPGSTSARPVNLLDIYPTLASLTGIEPPEGQLEGNDLSVLMKDPDAAWDEATVTTFGYKNYGVRSERYRYIVYEDGTEELYDHTNDKWEWKNLADNPEYTEVKKMMRKELPTHHQPNGVTYDLPGRKRTQSKK